LAIWLLDENPERSGRVKHSPRNRATLSVVPVAPEDNRRRVVVCEVLYHFSGRQFAAVVDYDYLGSEIETRPKLP
jgi:hypothetical protein